MSTCVHSEQYQYHLNLGAFFESQNTPASGFAPSCVWTSNNNEIPQQNIAHTHYYAIPCVCLMPTHKSPDRRRRRRVQQKRPTRRRTATRTVSREPGSIKIKDGTIVLMIPGKLRSLNQLRTGISRYGDTKAWEQRLKRARIAVDDESVLMPVVSRARLEMTRLSPSQRCFLDQTNLEGGVKGFEDALKRLGYIFDDNHKWIDRPQVQQMVSPDRQYWALAKITILE